MGVVLPYAGFKLLLRNECTTNARKEDSVFLAALRHCRRSCGIPKAPGRRDGGVAFAIAV